MPVIFLIPGRRGRNNKPASNAKSGAKPRPAVNLGGLGKRIVRWRSQARGQLSNVRQYSRPNRLPTDSTRPIPAPKPPAGPDPAELLSEVFSEPPVPLTSRPDLPQYEPRRPEPVKEFEIPQTLADLGMAPRPRGAQVQRFQTPAGRSFVTRSVGEVAVQTPPPPPAQEEFDLGLDGDEPYISMLEDTGPETIGAQLRNQRPGTTATTPRPRLVGASPFADDLDEEEFDEDLEEEEAPPPAPVPPEELVPEPVYDPNKRGLRRAGRGPRRRPIFRFENPRAALLAGVVSLLMLAGIVFLIILIAGSINRAPTGKFSVMFAPFGEGRTYSLFNSGQDWDQNLGKGLLANSALPNLDVRYTSTTFKDSASAAKQSLNNDTDVLVWGYSDSQRGKLVANLTLTPNGPYDPPFGRGRQIAARYLYDPDQMVFVTNQPTDPNATQGLTQLLGAISNYYSGNYDAALATLSDLLKQNVPENEPGLRMLRGNVLFLFGRYSEAIQDYTQIININQAALRNNLPTPINPAVVQNNLAMAYSFQGSYPEANKTFSTALGTNNTLPKVFENYALFLLDHTDMEFRPELLADWQSKLQNAIKLDPKSAAAYHYLGRVYYYQGNYAAAVDSENQARQLDENYLEVYYWMGRAKLALGQQNHQMSDLNGALDVLRWGEGRASNMVTQDHQRWEALNTAGNQTLATVWDAYARDAQAQLDLIRFTMARVYLEQTRLTGTDQGNPFDKLVRAVQSKKTPAEEAGPRLKDYLDTHPNDPDANFYYGQFLAVSGTGDPGPLYQKAKDLQKDLNKRFQYHQILAQQYQAAGQKDAALKEYTDFIALDKRRPQGYLALSQLQYQLGMFKEAAVSADSAIKLLPNNATAADAYLAAGAADVGALQFQQALSYLDRALVLNPNLAEAQFQRGLALFRLNRRNEALDSFSKALAINPNYSAAHYFSGIIYQENLHDNKSALTAWQKAVAINPKYADAWVKLGQTYSQVNQIDKAIEAYNNALAANETDAITHYYLGLLYEGQQTKNSLALAEQHYRRAIQLQPGLVNAYNHLALVIREQGGNGDDALKLAQDAVQLDKNSPEAQVVLGDIYRSRSEFDKAVPTYDAALKLRPNYPEALYGRSAAKLGLRQYDPALADVRQALQLRPTWADGLVLQGQIQVAKNDLNGANVSFEAARQLDPNNAGLLAQMGNLAELRNDTNSAVLDYENSLKVYEPNPDVHFKLGQLYFNRQDFNRALTHFQRTSVLNANWPRINYWLGLTYVRLNRQPDAQVALKKMVEQEPNFIEAHYELGNSYRTSGQRDAALAEYDAALKLQPAYAPAWLNKGLILEEMVNYPEAIKAFKNAQNTTDQQIRNAATTELQRLGAK